MHRQVLGAEEGDGAGVRTRNLQEVVRGFAGGFVGNVAVRRWRGRVHVRSAERGDEQRGGEGDDKGGFPQRGSVRCRSGRGRDGLLRKSLLVDWLKSLLKLECLMFSLYCFFMSSPFSTYLLKKMW